MDNLKNLIKQPPPYLGPWVSTTSEPELRVWKLDLCDEDSLIARTTTRWGSLTMFVEVRGETVSWCSAFTEEGWGHVNVGAALSRIENEEDRLRICAKLQSPE